MIQSVAEGKCKNGEETPSSYLYFYFEMPLGSVEVGVERGNSGIDIVSRKVRQFLVPF